MDAVSFADRSFWRRLIRDSGILLALLIIAWSLLAQADARRPPFSMADIQVVTGAIASFETVQVPERAAAPNINSTTFRDRAAFRLDGYPPNLLAYIPGSAWDMAADVAPGSEARLEVAENPAVLAAQARANPAATYLLAIAGLQIGDRVHFSASDTVVRAESAVRFFTRLAWVAATATAIWVVWLVWTYRQLPRQIRDSISGN